MADGEGVLIEEAVHHRARVAAGGDRFDEVDGALQRNVLSVGHAGLV